MNAGALLVQVGMELFSPENRAKRRARRAARRKERNGEALTQEELEIMSGEVVKVTLPDGSVVERKEPTIKARTSTKVAGVNVVGLLGAIGVTIPFYEQINGLIVQACESGDGPLPFLIGLAVAGAWSVATARLTKSPIVPGGL